MEKLDGKSKDIVKDNIDKIKHLFPDVFTEDGIDFDALKGTLGEYVDDKEERYQFTWYGKTQARRLAQTPSTGTLRPCKDESVNWDNTENLFIEGDNLEVLKLLQKSYHKKVKMIYIDPPYNTGNDFIYKDDFRDNIKNYKKITGQIDSEGMAISTNSETSGRYHTDWLNMMYPRLKLARNLLRDDGAIFISIDDNEVHNLRKICDEVFGQENCVGVISRMMKSGGNKGQYFSPNVEYVLVFAKSLSKLGYFRESISEETAETSYSNIEEFGERMGEKYSIKGLCQPGLGIRKNQRYWIQCPDGSFVIPRGINFPTKVEEGEKVIPTDEDTCWKWTYDRFKQEKEKNNVVFKPSTSATALVDENGKTSRWNVFNKIWLTDRQNEGRVPVNFISKWENRISSKELKELDIPFDFAKPSELIGYLVSLMENMHESIILDFFSGSATTAHAVIDLNKDDKGNRKFIMVQLPELCDEQSEAHKAGYKTIADIGKERIRRVIKKIKVEQEDKKKQGKGELFEQNDTDEKDLDLGFKVFKLDASNISTWDPNFDNVQQDLLMAVDNIKTDRSEEDVLYEILLKYGLDLTVPIEELEIKGKKVFVVGMGALVVCLATDVTIEIVEEISKLNEKYQPEVEMRVVFKDSSFKDDVVKTNAVQILKQNGIEDVKSI